MKKSVFALIALCVAFMAASCNKLPVQTGDETGTLYGTWVLDSYKIEVGGSVDEKGGTFPVTIPYNLKKTTLTLDESLVARAHMGGKTDWANYSYNGEKKQITFDRMIEVSDDGMIMGLYGLFDVAELNETTLILKQPYAETGKISLPSGTSFSTTAIAWYTYHRQTEKGTSAE